MKNNLRVICGALAGFMIGGATIVCANQAIQALQNTEIKVSLNGQIQAFKDEATGEIQYPITYNNRTYLPLRNVAQLAGLDVDYDASNNTALLEKSNNEKELFSMMKILGKYNINHAYYNSNEYYITDGGGNLGLVFIYDVNGNELFVGDGCYPKINISNGNIENFETYDVEVENFNQSDNYYYYKAYYKLNLYDGKFEKELIRVDKNDKINRADY